jgi:hypothetical protein|tara:strand:+ start:347 stop:484 length:138 start_codon:yes stop_codon:yes gene_type:complete
MLNDIMKRIKIDINVMARAKQELLIWFWELMIGDDVPQSIEAGSL